MCQGMSAPGYNFSCTKCEFTANYCAGRYSFRYRLSDGSLAHAPWEVGWCFACETIVQIQRGLSCKILESKCDELRLALAPKTTGFYLDSSEKKTLGMPIPIGPNLKTTSTFCPCSPAKIPLTSVLAAVFFQLCSLTSLKRIILSPRYRLTYTLNAEDSLLFLPGFGFLTDLRY
jgi:hypothetical protein